MDGENSTSPKIKSAVSNFPLQVNVPASRPTLPSKNSTGPENVTEFPSARLHFASEALSPTQTLDCGSVTVRVPFPSPCASKRKNRCRSLANVISTFHAPVMLGVCASDKPEKNVFTAITRITARVAFTFSTTFQSVILSNAKNLRSTFERSSQGNRSEMFRSAQHDNPVYESVLVPNCFPSKRRFRRARHWLRGIFGVNSQTL